MRALASVPHRLGSEPAAVPRIVLPITRRGVVVTDRVCWVLLAAAMVAAATLILYLNRGTVFFADEFDRFASTPMRSVGEAFESHVGHLTATSNLMFEAMLGVFGAEYVAFRVLGVLVVLLSAGLFYALVRSRIGALPALAPTVLLLFLGSSWEMVVIPFGFNVVFSTAAGLAALLALERGDRLGDALACGALLVSVATFSIGLAFTAGVAISVLLRPDRRRRAWVFLVPALLYAAWWLGASPQEDQIPGGEPRLSNALLIPGYVADSLAAVLAALSGLGYDFADPLGAVDLGWGRVLAVAAAVWLGVRIARRNVPRSLWTSLAIMLALWALGALVVGTLREPGAPRYLYAGSVVVLLVATDAMRGIRFSRRGLALLFGIAAIGVATNVVLLREGSAFTRDYSAAVRADLAAVELARDRVDPDFRPLQHAPLGQFFTTTAGEYFVAADRYGSPAFSPSELERAGEGAREQADRTLADALRLRLRPSPGGPAGSACRRPGGQRPGAPIEFELPVDGAELTARAAGPAPLTVGRFADLPSVDLGALRPGRRERLAIPADAEERPWRASVRGATSVRVCAAP